MLQDLKPPRLQRHRRQRRGFEIGPCQAPEIRGSVQEAEERAIGAVDDYQKLTIRTASQVTQYAVRFRVAHPLYLTLLQRRMRFPQCG